LAQTAGISSPSTSLTNLKIEVALLIVYLDCSTY